MIRFFYGILVIGPDVEFFLVNITASSSDSDSLNGEGSWAEDAVIDSHVDLALGPFVMLPIGAYVRIWSCFGQSSI